MQEKPAQPRFLLLAALALGLALLTGCRTWMPGTTLDVGQFGAVGDGQANDLPAFVAALDAARQAGGPVTLRVPDGSYRLVPGEDWTSGSHLPIDGFRNLTIEAGRQAVLVCGSPYLNGIAIRKSSGVRIRNLAVDYDPLPFTQGIIVAASPDDHTIDVRIEDGFPLPTATHIDAFAKKGTQNVGYVFDPDTGRKLNQFYDQYLRKQVESLGEGVYRYRTDNEVDPACVGKRFAVVGRRRADAVKVDASRNCLIERVEVYSAPACGYNVSNSSGITIDHCAIRQKPGTSRVMSTVADGLHSKWCPVGPTLSNSTFTGMGDDAVNIGGSYTPVVDQPDDHTLIVEVHGSITNYPDDLVSANRETHGHFSLGPVESIRGAKVEGYSRPCLKITFKRALPDMVTWKESGDKHKCSQVLNLNACGRYARVVNNHFYSHRVRGVLMRAPDSIIRGNHFDTLAGPAIVVSNDGGFLTEGPSGNGTIIEDNVFTRIERSCIWINSSIGPQSEKATQGIVGVRILNNRFEDYGGLNAYGRGTVGNVMFIRNASDLVIAGNVIGKPSAVSPAAPVVLMASCEDVTWRDNTVAGRPFDPARDIEPIEPAPPK